MNDDNLGEALHALRSSAAGTVVVPDYLCSAQLGLAKEVFPYVALNEDTFSQIDAILIHKGLMHRVGMEIISRVYFSWSPCFANDVFVLFTKSPSKFSSKSDSSDLFDHLGPLETFLAGEPASFGRSKPLRTAAVVSAYGVGNIGDDLVSIASKQLLLDVGLSDIVLTGPAPTYEQICNADVIALGGGGLFYDYDIENIANYIYPLQEAKRQRKPFLALGVGVQGIQSPLGKAIYKQNLPLADLLAIRNDVDANQLLELEPSLSNIFVGNDMAFYLADTLRASVTAVEKDTRIALFSVSITHEGHFRKQGFDLKVIAQKTISHLRAKGYEVLLTVHSTDDLQFYKELSKSLAVRIVSLERLGIFGTARLYASADAVVTSRFHALILSAIFGKPVVSLYGAGKGGRLLSSGLPSLKDQSQDINAFNLKEFLDKISNCKPPAREDVEKCIAGAVGIRDQVARVLANKASF
jgi:polysaccharide pyruvyl transferase WcaK-like protein